MGKKMNKFVKFTVSAKIDLRILLLKSRKLSEVEKITRNEIETLLDGRRGIEIKNLKVAVKKDPSEMSAEEIMKEIEGVK